MKVPPIIRTGDLRAENRRRVLEALRVPGAGSRIALGRLTGLSQGAISSFAAELVAEDIVHTVRLAGGRGRPRSALALAPGAASAITVSLTIDRLHVRQIDYKGVEISRLDLALQTRMETRDGLIDAIVATIESCRDASAKIPGIGPLRHVSVGFQGVTEHATGSLMWSPILSVTDVPLRAALQERLGLPATVENDCRLIGGALKSRMGEELGPSFVTVLFSHGVGLGLYLDGEPFSGARSSALEFGHLRYRRDGALCRCGRRGCIEAYAADYAIARAVDGCADDDPPGRLEPQRFEAFVQRALDGEAVAVDALAAAGHAVGDGLRQLFMLLDPMPVALVGRSDAGLAAMRGGIQAGLATLGAGSGPGPRIELHGIPEHDPLLQAGLALDALAALDRQLAAPAAALPSGGDRQSLSLAADGSRTPGQTRRRAERGSTALALVLLLAATVGPPTTPAQAAESTPSPPAWSDRSSILDTPTSDLPAHGRLDSVDLERFVERGGTLFAHRFTTIDGAGRPMATQAIIPTKRKRGPRSEYSRTAGLDANACSSCHNAPLIGGAGDFSANVFVSEGFEHTDFDTTDPQFSNERNTNHLFGAGLIELLAREMSTELAALRATALRRAREQGHAVRIELITKGIGFGTLEADPTGLVDTRKVRGVDADLVVRPFSQKGVMTSLRQFTVNALNHHHGIQPAERYGARWTGEADHDEDGLDDEIDALDISALVAWQAALPPPLASLEMLSSTGAPVDVVTRTAWRGAASRGTAGFQAIGCGECHRATLPLDSLVFDDPGFLDAAGTLRAGEVPGLQYDLGQLSWSDRLDRDAAGRVLVPLFGDLKRHSISDRQVALLGNERLSQRFVERDVFMTSELWGIASTAPYGHRGDLGTLAEVIEAHGGEARASRDAWLALDDAARDDIVAWLKTFVITP